MLPDSTRMVTSTSVVSRGRPQIVTACAPNRYQRTPWLLSAADNARSRSTGAEADGTERLADTDVDSQILFAIEGVRPIWADRDGVTSQFIAGAEVGGWCLLGVLPGARFCGGEPGPIALDELPDGIPRHASIVTCGARILGFDDLDASRLGPSIIGSIVADLVGLFEECHASARNGDQASRSTLSYVIHQVAARRAGWCIALVHTRRSRHRRTPCS